jgi:hypothetical protein
MRAKWPPRLAAVSQKFVRDGHWRGSGSPCSAGSRDQPLPLCRRDVELRVGGLDPAKILALRADEHDPPFTERLGACGP